MEQLSDGKIKLTANIDTIPVLTEIVFDYNSGLSIIFLHKNIIYPSIHGLGKRMHFLVKQHCHYHVFAPDGD